MANNNKHTGPNVPALRFPEFSGEWENRQIKDVATVIGGGTPDTNTKDYWNGDINWYTPSEIGKTKYVKGSVRRISQQGVDNSSAKILPKGAILLSTRATIGEKSITETTCCTNQGFQSLIPNASVDTDFCYYALDEVKTEMIRRASGSTFLEISSSQLSAISIHIPNSDEQKKIGSFLSLIDERIEAQNKIIEEQEILLKSLADKMFLQNNYSSKLSELVNIVKGKQLNADTLSETGDYYVMNGGITPSGYYSEYNVPAGAISISEGGNSCGYVQFNEKPFWSGGHCYSLQCKTNLVDYKYIYYYLKTKEADVMALRIGSGLPNIQKKDIEKFTISYPSLQQQKQIVIALDALSGKINAEKQLLEKYCQQKSYLLSQMFI